MNVITADNTNDNVMIDGIPNNDDWNNVLLNPVIIIIGKFNIQVPKVPETNPNIARLIFLVNTYTDIATMNPTIIEGIRKGKIKKARKVGRKDERNSDALKSRVTFELLITIDLVSY